MESTPRPSDVASSAAASDVDADVEDPAQRIASAEILAIGTELLLGDIVDTNGALIARTLKERGVDVLWSGRVGDNLGRIRAALDAAMDRSDLVVTCGGLGPTDDDLTREAIAACVGETPTVDAALASDLADWFSRSGRSMPSRNLKQAWTVPSCTPLPNPRGTAPGWLVRTVRDGRPHWIAALPGPPFELERMLEHELLPRLPLPASRLFTRTIKTLGLGESHLADRLGDLTTRANPSVATYAKADGVHVRVAAKGADLEAAADLARPVVDEVTKALADVTWGFDDDELAALVVENTHALGLRVALSEVATGGALVAALSAVQRPPKATERSPESEAVGGHGGEIVGAVIRSALEASVERTAVPDTSSTDTPIQRARAVRTTFAADAAIHVGEFRRGSAAAGGTSVDVAVSGPFGDLDVTIELPDRADAWLRARVVPRALDTLRRYLLRSDVTNDRAAVRRVETGGR